MALEQVTFKNSKGHVLTGMLRHQQPLGHEKYPAIIVLHGFSENMKHELTAELANALIYRGFLTLRFDFHGHGESEGEFEEHTIGQQVDDVVSALDFLSAHELVDPERIAVIGTDIGGNIAMLAASKDARIKAVVVQGARSHFDKHIASHFHQHDLREMFTKGVYEHARFKIRKEYVKSAALHDVHDELERMHAPLLIIHGTGDLRVRIEEAREILNKANDPKALEEVEGADHWFRGEGERERFIELAADWIQRWVR